MNKINILPVNFRSKNVRKSARTRSCARLRARKKIKCSKSFPIFFAYVSSHMEHLTKNQSNSHARAFFARSGILQHIIAKFSLSSCLAHFSEHFDTMFISLSLLITEWASVQNKYLRARGHVLHSIYGQRHAYKKYIGMNKDCHFCFIFRYSMSRRYDFISY